MEKEYLALPIQKFDYLALNMKSPIAFALQQDPHNRHLQPREMIREHFISGGLPVTIHGFWGKRRNQKVDEE